jgi:hypothetical protein
MTTLRSTAVNIKEYIRETCSPMGIVHGWKRADARVSLQLKLRISMVSMNEYTDNALCHLLYFHYYHSTV